MVSSKSSVISCDRKVYHIFIKDVYTKFNALLISLGLYKKVGIWFISQLKVIDVYYIEEFGGGKELKEGIVKFVENRVFGQNMDRMPHTVPGL